MREKTRTNQEHIPPGALRAPGAVFLMCPCLFMHFLICGGILYRRYIRIPSTSIPIHVQDEIILNKQKYTCVPTIVKGLALIRTLTTHVVKIGSLLIPWNQ